MSTETIFTDSVAAKVAIGSVAGILLRPVEVSLAAATAAADDDLDDEDSQDHVGIVLVNSIFIKNVVTLVSLTIVLAGSQRDGGKLSSCVEAENTGCDEGCQVNATEQAADAEAAEAGVKDPRAESQAELSESQGEQSHAAEGVNDRESRSQLNFV